MTDTEAVKREIRAAFGNVKYPGDERLRGSDLGDEPYRVEVEFRGKSDWQSLDATFVDAAPDGLGSALCFFSDEAFHFYLPAYLLADLDEKLNRVDPVFHLTHGLDEATSRQLVNYLQRDSKMWFESAAKRFKNFDSRQAAEVVSYLRWRSESSKTWFEYAVKRVKNFDSRQAAAVVSYLRWRSEREILADEKLSIEESLENFWLGRTCNSPGS